MTKDPEIQAQARILAALKDLDPETLARVMRWAQDRFGPKPIHIPSFSLIGGPGTGLEAVTVTEANGSTSIPGSSKVLFHDTAGSMREPPKLGRDA